MDWHVQLPNLLHAVGVTPCPSPNTCIFMCKYWRDWGTVHFTRLFRTKDSGRERERQRSKQKARITCRLRAYSSPNFPVSGDQKSPFTPGRYHETTFMPSTYRQGALWMLCYLKPHLWLAAELESVSFVSKVTFLSNKDPKPVLQSICCCFSYLHP